jgi:hypothetical protein
MKERISRLEEFKWKVAGWTAAAFIVAWALEHAVSMHDIFK